MKLSGPFKMPRSKRGAKLQYNAIIRAAFRAMRGGLSFGMDWPTFRVCFPEAYAHVCAMRAAFSTLPE